MSITKKLRILNCVIIIFLGIVMISIQSCKKDDDAIIPVSEQNTDVDGGIVKKEEKFITLYKVDGDHIIKEKDFKVKGKFLEFQKDTKKHQQVWNLVKKIVPIEYRSKMSEFMIYFGNGDSAGYVVSNSNDLSKWQMGIAVDDAYYNGIFDSGGEITYTIIHELGHIITLEKAQVNSTISEDECTNFFTGEGCSRKKSNINILYQNHWADIWGEFKGSNSETAKMNFYNKYKERYVTPYASTNPGEDIAEVFTEFVIRSGGVKVNVNNRVEQKIKIMYDDKEMIKFRNHIRKNITKKSKRSLSVLGTLKNTHVFANRNKKSCLSHGD
ncbi:hypothetical protein [Aquimarina longa]|uniref:hypothetical protein n=1 Tax=Aquimarina longa TaxID=1080221 RepID=UPI0011DF5669|nr:hypothetical protein [Aquimarina longa]